MLDHLFVISPATARRRLGLAMPDRRARVLIAGVSTRALAGSAARAGYRVSSRSTPSAMSTSARSRRSSRSPRETGGFSPDAAADAGRPTAERTLVAYTSNFENHPGAVARLAPGAACWATLPTSSARSAIPSASCARFGPRAVRAAHARERAADAQPALLPGCSSRAARAEGTAPVPGEGRAGPAPGVPPGADRGRARLGDLPRRRPTSASARAHPPAGGRACVRRGGLPLLRQPARLSAGRRCSTHEARLRAAAVALAQAVTEEFGLVGLNGIDFIARDGVPYPIEVNPRYSASMELVERAGGPSLFELHARACSGRAADGAAGRNRIPPGPGQGDRVRAPGCGGGGDPRPLAAAMLADLPHPGERIGRGHPICTVCSPRLRDACRAAGRELAARAPGALCRARAALGAASGAA